jgi:hypothetical protein
MKQLVTMETQAITLSTVSQVPISCTCDKPLTHYFQKNKWHKATGPVEESAVCTPNKA